MIIIYGAGAIANLTFLYYQSLGKADKVSYFAVTQIGNNRHEKYGIPVKEWNEIKETVSDSDKVVIAVQNRDKREIEELLKTQKINKIEKIDSEEIVNQFYAQLWKKPIIKNRIVLSNMKGLGYGCNPKYICEELYKKYGNQIELIWCSHIRDKDMPDYVRYVQYGSLEYYESIATAKVWIDNARKDSDIIKREGQLYVQAWHGAAPFKKVEFDATQSLSDTYLANAVSDSNMADLFLSGSNFYSQLYRKSFRYTGEILEKGLPRQDVFFCDEGIKEKIYVKYGIAKEAMFVLYAPTFRDACDMDIYNLDIERCINALALKFKKNIIIGVSKHPTVRDYQYSKFSFYEQIIDVSTHGDFEELLAASDVLISDYSGCVYDYSFTKRPVFLYQPDLKDYLKERDFYVSVDEWPYMRAITNDEMIAQIEQYDEKKYLSELDTFMGRFGNYDRGQAAQEVVEWIAKRI